MPTPWSCLAAMVLALAGDGDAAGRARVEAEAAEVFVGPGPGEYAVGTLRRGDRVVVRRAVGAAWVEVEPPPGGFEWVDPGSIAPRGDGLADVVAAQTVPHCGRPGAASPGPPRPPLIRGAVVRLVDRPDLVVPLGGGKGRTWRAIAPTPGARRFVRRDALGPIVADEPAPTPEIPPSPTPAPTLPPVDIVLMRAATGPPPPGAGSDALAEADLQIRATVQGPVEGWRFEGVRSQLGRLRGSSADADLRVAVDARLARLDRLEEVARSAREFSALVEASRERDRRLAEVRGRRRLAEAKGPRYAASGLLQPSSKMVEGRKVYALIGGDGLTVAYLDLPAGLDASRELNRRVGVYGEVRYDGGLRAKVIAVHDLDPLERR